MNICKGTSKEEQIWVRVTPELKQWAQTQADKDGRSLSNWIAHNLEQTRRED